MSEQYYLGNPLLKKSDVQHNFTKKEIEEYIKCRDDIIYFLETHVKIVHVDKGLIPFSLYIFFINQPNGVCRSVFVII